MYQTFIRRIALAHGYTGHDLNVKQVPMSVLATQTTDDSHKEVTTKLEAESRAN